MADFTADFEAGVNGNPVTTAEASATALDVTGNLVYDTTHVAHGTLSAKGPSGSTAFAQWTLASVTDHYGRLYLYATAAPASDELLLATGSGTLKINTSGVLILDAGAQQSFTTPIATNQWVRIEFHFVHSTTVGQIEIKLFNDADSASATETQSSPASWNTGASATSVQFRLGSGWGSDLWLDDLVGNATNWVGPVASYQTMFASADSVDGAWTDDGGGTSLAAAIDETTASDTDYIRSELNPSTSGCRVKLQAGGDPHVSTNHTINWRTGKVGSATVNMTVKLYQGGGDSLGAGTLIASFERDDVGALTTYQETLSGGEADSITDYTDLYLEFFADTA